MLRHPARSARTALTGVALGLALALAGCGIKGPLVPAKKPDAAPPPPATTAPQVPSATPPANPQPAP